MIPHPSCTISGIDSERRPQLLLYSLCGLSLGCYEAQVAMTSGFTPLPLILGSLTSDYPASTLDTYSSITRPQFHCLHAMCLEAAKQHCELHPV